MPIPYILAHLSAALLLAFIAARVVRCSPSARPATRQATEVAANRAKKPPTRPPESVREGECRGLPGTGRTRCRGGRTAAILVGTFLIVGAGFIVERRSDLAWRIISWSIRDLVFLTNLSIEGASVLAVLLFIEV